MFVWIVDNGKIKNEKTWGNWQLTLRYIYIEYIYIYVSFVFVSVQIRYPIDINSAIVQVMAWRWTGPKPLLEPMMTHFFDVFMRHPAPVS